MGLDNGFLILKMDKEDMKKAPYYKEHWYCPESESFEPIYWRKCYNLREAVFRVLHGEKNDTFEYQIKPNDIPELIENLRPFLNKIYWDDHDDCIWDYDEMFDDMYKALVFLEWFQSYYKDHPEIEMIFYDSY